jgi:hypothetical protein
MAPATTMLSSLSRSNSRNLTAFFATSTSPTNDTSPTQAEDLTLTEFANSRFALIQRLEGHSS